MRFSNPSKICPLILCLMLNLSATGTPRFRGAASFMKEIKLTQGKVALVDDEDFEFLNQFKWRAHKGKNTFYAVRSIKKDMEWMHRVILNISDSKIFADHRDHDGLNNQKYNLRTCSGSQNNANQVKQKKQTSSIYKGVYYCKITNKWCAQIQKNSKTIVIGRFITEIEAATARNEKAIELFGEFANLNVIK